MQGMPRRCSGLLCQLCVCCIKFIQSIVVTFTTIFCSFELNLSPFRIFLGRTQLAPKSGAHMPYYIVYINSSHHIREHFRNMYASRLHHRGRTTASTSRLVSHFICIKRNGKNEEWHRHRHNAWCTMRWHCWQTQNDLTHCHSYCTSLAGACGTRTHTHIPAFSIVQLIVLIAATRLCVRAREYILKLKRRSRRGIRRRRRDRDSFHFYNFPVLIFNWLWIVNSTTTRRRCWIERNNDEYIKYKEQKCEP